MNAMCRRNHLAPAGRILLALLLPLLCRLATGAEAPMEFALTGDDIDYAQCREFPAAPDLKAAMGYAKSREEGLRQLLHLKLPLPPHGGWNTGVGSEQKQHFRLAFLRPVAIGTMLCSDGWDRQFFRPFLTGESATKLRVSALRPEAAYPGDVERDADWTDIPIPAGQAGELVLPFPAGLSTRALRISFLLPQLRESTNSSRLGGLMLLKDRMHNLTPEATIVASSTVQNVRKVLGQFSNVEAYQAENLVSGKGSWRSEVLAPDAPFAPQWLILSWPEAKTFCGLGLVNIFAKRFEVDCLDPAEAAAPALAAEGSWRPLGGLDWPVWWRPAYTDAFVPFSPAVQTRALRIRFTQPLTNESSDIIGLIKRNGRVVEVGGVLALTGLAENPVPPRPAPKQEQPPIKIGLTMPYDGLLTVAIDDEKGKRVRNLVAQVARSAGALRESWDGTDDQGKLVAPGRYQIKALTHAPLHLNYQLTVNCSGNPPWFKWASWSGQRGAGGWLSDHCPPNDITVIGEQIFIGAKIAESGHTVLACDLDGNKLWGVKWLTETSSAGYLANDGKKVYAASEGGWMRDRLMINEIDPHSYEFKKVAQLDFTGNISGGLSGLAVRDGKLYVSFNQKEPSWLASCVAPALVDDAASSTFPELQRLLRIKHDNPARTAYPGKAEAAPLRLALREPLPIGTVLTADPVTVRALRAAASYPGDPSDDKQWEVFPSVKCGTWFIHTAPAGLLTRALRFDLPAATDPKRKPVLRGAQIAYRRFHSVAPAPVRSVTAGELNADGNWRVKSAKPISSENSPALILSWKEPVAWRGLALQRCFARQVEVSTYSGPASADPTASPESAWTVLGNFSPAVVWRPLYHDDYFDAGKTVTSRAIRLRIVAPFTTEDNDIKSATGGLPLTAGIADVCVLAPAGGEAKSVRPASQRISIYNLAAKKWEKHLPVAAPAFPHFDAAGRLLCVSGSTVAAVDPATGTVTPVITSSLTTPRGIATDAQGNLYVADGAAQQIFVFSASGKLLRKIGEPGGRTLGAYNRLRLANPQGIALDPRGNLWVAESDFQPKRTSVWSRTGEFVKEFIGPAHYGGGGSLDPQDKRRFYYNGMEFGIDWTNGKWELKRILTRDQPAFAGYDRNGEAYEDFSSLDMTRYADKPVYRNNRQYMVNDPGKMGCPLLLVGEFRGDRVVPMTVLGNAENWQPFKTTPLSALLGGLPANRFSFQWVDTNDDALPQPGEVELSPLDVRLNPTYWPTCVNDKLELQLGNRLLRPVSFTASGAPVYKPFTEDNRLPPLPAENIYATAVDSQGRVIVNGRPLLALTQGGATAWSYPQNWVGVHDSQGAPGPRPGLLIGCLGFLGQATIPGLGNTFMMNDNRGQYHLFTEDGLYAATLWHDHNEPGAIFWFLPKAERGMNLDQISLGGEHFGGGFFATKDGKFYLVAGHNHNSIVELTGLETMRRQETSVTISADDFKKAEAYGQRQAALRASRDLPKVLSLAAPATAITTDGDLVEWPEASFLPIPGRGSFAIAADAQNLYLAYRVESGAALRNNGTDPQMMFKTGDSVDLQLGTNPTADAKRNDAAPGDLRLLLTLREGKPLGVLYQHRVPGTPQEKRTAFLSPSRAEYVDRITYLDPSLLTIVPTKDGYVVEATIPLPFLGWKPQPGKSYRADFGILSADPSGSVTTSRTYWSNRATGLVSDVPGEIKLTPALWGTINTAK